MWMDMDMDKDMTLKKTIGFFWNIQTAYMIHSAEKIQPPFPSLPP